MWDPYSNLFRFFTISRTFLTINFPSGQKSFLLSDVDPKVTVAILHKPDNKSDIMGDDAAKFDLRLFFRESGKTWPGTHSY